MPEKAYNILIITMMLSEFMTQCLTYVINNGYVTFFFGSLKYFCIVYYMYREHE